MKPFFDLSLYLVTDRSLSLGRPLAEIVENAVKGGVTMVQLREKEASSLEFFRLAVELKKILRPHRIPLIINDRLDIALACDAEGVHLGQSDLPFTSARKIMGNNKIIGVSVENTDQAEELNKYNIDYIGISPVFGTLTKTDTAKPLGLEGIRKITNIADHPAVGIGGINKSNAKDIIEAGADGISVVSAIMSAVNPKDAAKELLSIVEQSKKNK